MYWASALAGILLLLAAIQLYDVLPRPVRVVIGLIGTALLIVGVSAIAFSARRPEPILEQAARAAL